MGTVLLSAQEIPCPVSASYLGRPEPGQPHPPPGKTSVLPPHVPGSAPASGRPSALPCAVYSDVICSSDPTRKRVSLVLGLPHGPSQFLSHEIPHTPCDNRPPATLMDPAQLQFCSRLPSPETPKSKDPGLSARLSLWAFRGRAHPLSVPIPPNHVCDTWPPAGISTWPPPPGTSNPTHPCGTPPSQPAAPSQPLHGARSLVSPLSLPLLPPAKLTAQCSRRPNMRPSCSALPPPFPLPRYIPQMNEHDTSTSFRHLTPSVAPRYFQEKVKHTLQGHSHSWCPPHLPVLGHPPPPPAFSAVNTAGACRHTSSSSPATPLPCYPGLTPQRHCC